MTDTSVEALRFRAKVKHDGAEVGDLPYLEEFWAVRASDYAALLAERDRYKAGKREAWNEALREAFNTLRAYAPHHVDGPEHDVGYASGYATAQNRILSLITEDQSDE